MIEVSVYDMIISIYTVISIMVLLSTVIPARSFKELYRAMLITVVWPILPVFTIYAMIIDCYKEKNR